MIILPRFRAKEMARNGNQKNGKTPRLFGVFPVAEGFELLVREGGEGVPFGTPCELLEVPPIGGKHPRVRSVGVDLLGGTLEALLVLLFPVADSAAADWDTVKEDIKLWCFGHFSFPSRLSLRLHHTLSTIFTICQPEYFD